VGEEAMLKWQLQMAWVVGTFASSGFSHPSFVKTELNVGGWYRNSLVNSPFLPSGYIFFFS
jgi:hypothetical protein